MRLCQRDCLEPAQSCPERQLVQNKQPKATVIDEERKKHPICTATIISHLSDSFKGFPKPGTGSDLKTAKVFDEWPYLLVL